ncbi:MAG: ferric reductase-like transmembrane domain-containing protein [Nitrolancea sp.]
MSTSTSNLLWYVGRGSGITAYLLLTFSVVLGIALSRRWHSTRLPRMVIDELHRWLTTTFYVFVAIHIVTILIDPFTHFRVIDVIVPFASGYRPIWLSLGIIGTELSIAAGASVWVRKWIGYRVWHVLHLTAYPIFLMSLLHGIGTGTDTKTSWMTLLYVISFVLVAGATLWRLIEIPAWRTGVIATTLVVAVALVVWGLGGPYADGWAKAAGTPDKLLQKAAVQKGLATADSATPTTATATPTSTGPQLPTNIQDTITGETLLNDERTQALFRGTGQGTTTIDVAIQLQVISSQFTGQIQLRTADHTPLCSGEVTGQELDGLTATCSGYGQTYQLRLSLDPEGRDGFRGALNGALNSST